MKRFPAREAALLCSPLVIVVGASWLARNRPRSPEEGPLRMVFRVEEPTVLEAFDGVDAALVIDLKGPNTTQGDGKDALRIWQVGPWLQLKTPTGTQTSRGNNPGKTKLDAAWKGYVNSSRFKIDFDKVPPGQLVFGTDAQVSPMSTGAQPTSPRLSGKWKVDRARIKPFPFSKLPRNPQIVLRSVSIVKVNPNGNVVGEAVFDLLGPQVKEQTPLDLQFTERRGGMSSGWGNSGMRTKQTLTRRVREWTVYKPRTGGDPDEKPMVRVTGRVSADNWRPLAFKIEPFDFTRAKVGQKLTFRQWPVPNPKAS